MPLVKYPLTDFVDRMSDRQLNETMINILAYFHDYSMGGACPGDIVVGWDWLTMRVMFPELCAKYTDLRVEALKRLEASNGVFDDLTYVKAERGWVSAD